MKRHANNREPSTENTAHLPSSFEENLAEAIRRTATHLYETLTRDPEDFKNSLDLTK